MFGGGWRAGAGMVADPKKEQRPTAVSVIHGGDSMSEMAPVAFSAPSICIALPRQTVSVVRVRPIFGSIWHLTAFIVGFERHLITSLCSAESISLMTVRLEMSMVYGTDSLRHVAAQRIPPHTHTQNPQDCRTPPEFLGCSAPSHNDWVTEDREASAPRTAHSPSRDALAAPRRQLASRPRPPRAAGARCCRRRR